MSQASPIKDPPQSSPPKEVLYELPPQNMSGRNVSTDPINFGIDSTEDEFKPSKVSRLIQFAVDEVKRNYNIDPTGEEYCVVIATSLDKGETFKVLCDSTDDQHWLGTDMWSAQKINKEMMDMKLKQDEIINMAKEKLKEEENQDANT